jgi:hypothetical protein
MNRLTLDARSDLPEVCAAEAVIIGSGTQTRQVQLSPKRQLIAAQCSDTFLLAKLGQTGQLSTGTVSTRKPCAKGASVRVVSNTFVAHGNIATAGSCLSAHYLSTRLITRLKGKTEVREGLHYLAPVGEKESYVTRARAHVLSQQPMYA